MELKNTSRGYETYLAALTQKEVLAKRNLVESAQQILGLLPV